ncbi:Protein DEHYDRATION-INDUCED 19 [Camellia lanceoleosa]|uniref:Protein DEHYDRATION-INDUCED 19 n=1 Tax=Camellia lanceoleosa TaxID=1840588 RepID=A0ACC0ISI6_9ERIC|nr:Protein DEHYDRATION-INDUCED 19 [Camellia lanceoleosa]
MQKRCRLRRVAIPNSQALSLLGRDLREAHLQVLLGGSGYRSSNANSSNAVTDPFFSSLILNFPSSESEDILKSVLSSADDSFVKSVSSSHIWKASEASFQI